MWVLGLGALALVVCCGGASILAWRFGSAAKDFMANMATSDPAEIRRQTKEMLNIAIPEQFQPMQGMNMVAFRMLMFQTDTAADGSSGMLMLMELPMQQMGVNAEEQERELRKSMQQQQANQGLTQTNSETRDIQIRGEPIAFEFSEGTNSSQGQDKKIHMVGGVVRGNRGPVMIQFTLPEEQYDEAEVIETLQSIQ